MNKNEPKLLINIFVSNNQSVSQSVSSRWELCVCECVSYGCGTDGLIHPPDEEEHTTITRDRRRAQLLRRSRTAASSRSIYSIQQPAPSFFLSLSLCVCVWSLHRGFQLSFSFNVCWGCTQPSLLLVHREREREKQNRAGCNVCVKILQMVSRRLKTDKKKCARRASWCVQQPSAAAAAVAALSHGSSWIKWRNINSYCCVHSILTELNWSKRHHPAAFVSSSSLYIFAAAALIASEWETHF